MSNQARSYTLTLALTALAGCDDAQAQRPRDSGSSFARDAALPIARDAATRADSATHRDASTDSAVTACVAITPSNAAASVSYVRLVGRVGALRIPLGSTSRAQVLVRSETAVRASQPAGPCFAFERSARVRHDVIASAVGWSGYRTQLHSTPIDWEQHSSTTRALELELDPAREALIDTNPSSAHFGGLRDFRTLAPPAQAQFRRVLLQQLNEHPEQTIELLRARGDVPPSTVAQWRFGNGTIRDWDALGHRLHGVPHGANGVHGANGLPP